jgi:ParB/RepB/Spo0J family partition protein
MASTNRIASSDLEMVEILPRQDAYRKVDTEAVDFHELCDSIEQVGVIHPIVVRPKGDKFEILSGHRRFRACQHLGFSTLPCRILNVKDELAAAVVEFVTNAVRTDPKPCEYARAVYGILQKMGGDIRIHHLCAIINKRPEWIRDRLTLLNLETVIQEDVDADKTSIKAGVILSKLPKTTQLKFRRLAQTHTAKQLANLVRNQKVTSEVNKQLRLGCVSKQREYPKDVYPRTKKELSDALDDPYLLEYACSGSFAPNDARLVREVLLWVCQLDPEAVIRRRQILELRKQGRF